MLLGWGVKVSMSPESYTIDCSKFNGTFCSKPDYCAIILTTSVDESMYLLGDTFMRHVYTVFDYGEEAIYMAHGSKTYAT